MQDVRITLRHLAEEAATLHAKERRVVFESILLVGQLDARNAAVNLNLSTEEFATRIGLTIDQWYKRCRAARLVRMFPKVRAMLEAGEIKASHVEMMYPVITQANQNVMLDGIKGKGRREVEAFMRRVTRWGEVLPESEVEVEVKVRLTTEEAVLLERATEILAVVGKAPAAKDVLVQALAELVERRGPGKGAEQASAARQKVVPVIPAEARAGEVPQRFAEARRLLAVPACRAADPASCGAPHSTVPTCAFPPRGAVPH